MFTGKSCKNKKKFAYVYKGGCKLVSHVDCDSHNAINCTSVSKCKNVKN